MADPTRVQIETMFQNLVAVSELIRSTGAGASGVIGLLETFHQSLITNYPAPIGSAVQSVRSEYNSSLLANRAASDWLIREYGRFIGVPETDVNFLLGDRIYQYMHDNSLTVKARNFTFGAASAAGGNNGDGTLERLTVDENGYEIESGHAEVKTFECIRDEHSGAGNPHAEVFEVRGEDLEPDGIVVNGSGVKREINVINASIARSFVTNPSFSQATGSTGSGNLTALTGWTVSGTITSTLELDETTTYRPIPGESTPRAVRIKANERISQDLSNRRARFLANTPYYAHVAYNITPGSVTSGTLLLTFGAQSASVDLSAAAAGWQVLKIPIGTGNWYKNFNQAALTVELKLSGLGGSYLLVDDVIVAPFTYVDTLPFALVGGATQFLRDDKITVTDSIPSDSKLQKFFAERYGLYVPSNDVGGETWTDPA